MVTINTGSPGETDRKKRFALNSLQTCETAWSWVRKKSAKKGGRFYPSRWDSSTSCVCPRSGWLQPLCSTAADPPPASKRTRPWRRDEAARRQTCRPPEKQTFFVITTVSKCGVFVYYSPSHTFILLPCCEWRSRCRAEPPGHRWERWRGSYGWKSGQILGCYHRRERAKALLQLKKGVTPLWLHQGPTTTSTHYQTELALPCCCTS